MGTFFIQKKNVIWPLFRNTTPFKRYHENFIPSNYFVLSDLTMLEPQQNDLRTILFNHHT